MTATGDLAIVPANQATWAQLRAVFGQRSAAAVCWCQRYELRPIASFRDDEPAGGPSEGCIP